MEIRKKANEELGGEGKHADQEIDELVIPLL
jgi:hypothetical protein